MNRFLIGVALVLLVSAILTGVELRRLRLENDHLAAECAMKNEYIRTLTK